MPTVKKEDMVKKDGASEDNRGDILEFTYSDEMRKTGKVPNGSPKVVPNKPGIEEVKR